MKDRAGHVWAKCFFILARASSSTSGRLQKAVLWRMGLLICASFLLPLAVKNGVGAAIAFTLAITGEWLGRWLFFVSVVPKNLGAAFTGATA